MTMRWSAAFFALSLALTAAALAAELPSRQTKPSTAPVKRCEIAGKPGYLAGDGQTCIRLGGYVSGQVSVGTLK